jgi:hypothetical protein
MVQFRSSVPNLGFLKCRFTSVDTLLLYKAASGAVAAFAGTAAGAMLLAKHLSIFAAVVFAIEFVFAVYYYTKIWPFCQVVPEHHAPRDYDIDKTVHNFLRHLSRVRDIKAFLSGWFQDAPFDSIYRDNVLELLSYAFWYRPL